MTDRPCAADDEQKELKVRSPVKEKIVEDEVSTQESSDENAIRSSQILGTWTNGQEKSILNGFWEFTPTRLIETKPGGLTHSFRYTLKGNTLTIHHTPLEAQPWDQESSLELLSDSVLIWTEDGISIKLYKVLP